MSKCLVQVKMCVIVDVEIDADSLEGAIEAGNKLKWENLVHPSTKVSDGEHAVIAVSDTAQWDAKLF